jgi:putative tryptophan/tyrosine transport system substrate-binding protein
MLRRAVLALSLVVGICSIAVPLAADAQRAGHIPRVGVLVFADMTDDFRQSFSQGLRDQGYVEGQNILVEWGSANGRPDRASALAAEYVRTKVDVIVASLTAAVQAAQKATRSIPIVMAPAGDPVKQGFAMSLARPGGNMTGVTGIELSEKRLELLKELIPDLRRASLLLNSADPSFAKVLTDGTGTAARRVGVQIQIEMVQGPDQFESAFAAMTKQRSDAVIVQPSLIGQAARASQVAKLALQHGLPSISISGTFPDSGGLISYGPNFRYQYRRSAAFVARILKGEKPDVMPIEQATTFEMVINLKTAGALGLTIPQTVLLRADRVIE